jgi:hypothetical protein
MLRPPVALSVEGAPWDSLVVDKLHVRTERHPDLRAVRTLHGERALLHRAPSEEDPAWSVRSLGEAERRRKQKNQKKAEGYRGEYTGLHHGNLQMG